MESCIIHESKKLDSEDRKALLSMLINNYGLIDIISTTNEGSMINLDAIKTDRVIEELFDFIRLKKSK